MLTQAILRRYQNSLCLDTCICITTVSAVVMFFNAFSSLGNKSMMRCLHTRIVLQRKRKMEKNHTWLTGNCKIVLQVGWTWHVCVCLLKLNLPQVGVHVFQHSVLVLNCLKDGLYHVWAVTVAMWRVRACRRHTYTIMYVKYSDILHNYHTFCFFNLKKFETKMIQLINKTFCTICNLFIRSFIRITCTLIGKKHVPISAILFL